MGLWDNKPVNLQELNQEIAFRIKTIMCTEGDLIRLALDDLVYGTLEADWAAMDMLRKEELVLEGLYQAACVAPRLGHDSRLACPEMTIGHLVGDGEYNFVHMVSITLFLRQYSTINLLQLKHLIDHDSTGNARVKSVFFFTHPYFEHDNRHSDAAPDFVKAALYWKSLLRTFYIVNTLLGILYAYVYSVTYLFLYLINGLTAARPPRPADPSAQGNSPPPNRGADARSKGIFLRV
jgi:hypothetical protein